MAFTSFGPFRATVRSTPYRPETSISVYVWGTAGRDSGEDGQMGNIDEISATYDEGLAPDDDVTKRVDLYSLLSDDAQRQVRGAARLHLCAMLRIDRAAAAIDRLYDARCDAEAR